MLSDVRVLTAPASDTSSIPSVLLQIGADKYLFGVGEGTSRASAQRRANISRVANLFLPRISFDALGGLPGTLMTLADGNRQHVAIHGPQNLAHTMATMRFYTKRDTMKMEIVEYPFVSHQAGTSEKRPFFQDDNLAIHAIPLLPHGFLASDSHTAHLEEGTRTSTEARSSEGASSKRQRVRSLSADAPLDLAKAPWSDPNWRPSRLRGPNVDLWVKAITEDMFSHRGIHQAQIAENGNRVDLDVETSNDRATRPKTPAFVTHPLPPPRLAPVPPPANSSFPDSDPSIVGDQAPSLAFICLGHSQRGKFDPVTATAEGVSPGPDFARLTRGEVVTIQRPANWHELERSVRERWIKENRLKNAKSKAQGKRKEKGKKKGDEDAAAVEPPSEWGELVSVEIQPDQVLGQSRAGPVFFYIHLPSKAYIPSLLSKKSTEAFKPFTEISNGTKSVEQRLNPHVIIHAVPIQVFQDQRYQRWMADFGSSCHHVVANHDVCRDELMFPSAATIQLRLSKMDSRIFQLPRYELEPLVPLDKGMGDCQVRGIPAEVDMQIQLQPRGEPSRLDSGAPRLDFEPLSKQAEEFAAFENGSLGTSEGRNGAEANNATGKARLESARKKAWVEYVSLAESIRNEIEEIEKSATGQSDPNLEGLILTPLGTGSAHPSKYRNVTSTLVQTRSDGSFLLDAGEGTYGQLRRKFGKSRSATSTTTKTEDDPVPTQPDVDDVLRDIKFIFISHIHADHHIGLSKLLLERRKLDPPPKHPLYVIGTSFVLTYIREYDAIESLGLDDSGVAGVQLIDNFYIDWRKTQDDTSASSNADRYGADDRVALAKLVDSMGFEKFGTVKVVHRGSHCYGITMTHRQGWSLVYSGDTRPCQELIAAGRNASVLIHEASLEDEEIGLAISKGHSTYGEAIQVAKEMRARNLLLTHFSQRYPKLARISNSSVTTTKTNSAKYEGIQDGGDHVGKGSDGRERKDPVVALAFDLVSYPASELWKVEKYTAAMEQLFAADIEDDAVVGGEEEEKKEKGSATAAAADQGGKASLHKDEGKGKAEVEAKDERENCSSKENVSHPLGNPPPNGQQVGEETKNSRGTRDTQETGSSSSKQRE
ncbi:hypothetical protein IE53DRAFT_382693 [Violaceomyces palustris]|uniref:Uncharacterized protein n=1 Tax=Violaceomyces palustris TaxID=1673888 RepID=A0ACD0NLN6_9BASI|nr:hypothetical protein IE53DRAFT_382693 [Violaceomyces palustris]